MRTECTAVLQVSHNRRGTCDIPPHLHGGPEAELLLAKSVPLPGGVYRGGPHAFPCAGQPLLFFRSYEVFLVAMDTRQKELRIVGCCQA